MTDQICASCNREWPEDQILVNHSILNFQPYTSCFDCFDNNSEPWRAVVKEMEEGTLSTTARDIRTACTAYLDGSYLSLGAYEAEIERRNEEAGEREQATKDLATDLGDILGPDDPERAKAMAAKVIHVSMKPREYEELVLRTWQDQMPKPELHLRRRPPGQRRFRFANPILGPTAVWKSR